MKKSLLYLSLGLAVAYHPIKKRYAEVVTYDDRSSAHVYAAVSILGWPVWAVAHAVSTVQVISSQVQDTLNPEGADDTYMGTP